MLKNEVGHDGAAPALEQTRNEGLLTEFNNAIADSTTLKVVGGAALLAGGVAATAAAVKFGKPLLGLGKAVAPEADEAVLTGLREAAAGSKAADGPFMMPATEALVSAGKKIDIPDRAALAAAKPDALAAIDPYGFRFAALARPAETGVLGVVKDSGMEASIKAAFKNKVPASERLGFKEVDPKIPMFSTMDDIKALMPHPDSPHHRVVMKLDGVARDVSVTDAISILAERAIKFVGANPGAAAKAYAERMPRPMIERDVSAMTGRMAEALDAAKVSKV